MPKFKGTEVLLYGKTFSVGDSAPALSLVGNDLSDVVVGGASGKWQVISIMPSIDTGVCQKQTHEFNKKAASLPNVDMFSVSADLPFALGRFCGAEGVKDMKVVSDFRGLLFGKVYGLLMQSGPLRELLTRAVIVVNPEGKIVYQEVCDEITNEPDYDKALKAIS